MLGTLVPIRHQEDEMLSTAFVRCPGAGLPATTSKLRLTRSAPEESMLDR